MMTSNIATPEASVPASTADHSSDGFRETVESVVVAFVLAFLFRAFIAEPFVIPTGSMAPTLMGQHKDFDCPECGFAFQVGVPEDWRLDISECTCPNCRVPLAIQHDQEELTVDPRYRSYKGDRIIVSKFAYEFADPERWDVAVFKYPATAKVNFIKRIVGLPNETLYIWRGDIFTQDQSGAPMQIERKPAEKVLALLQPVYHLDHRSAEQAAVGIPDRWLPVAPIVAGSFQPLASGTGFQTSGQAAETTWLRYEHRVPTREDWDKLVRRVGDPRLRDELATIKPDLVLDVCGYDMGRGQRGMDSSYRGQFWVGDLALDCQLTVDAVRAGSEHEVVLELVEGGRAFQAKIDLTTGTATLAAEGLDGFRPQAPTSVRGTGKYDLRFANVDDQLLLWVNDRLVDFSKPTTYDLPWQRPDARDTAPAAIGIRGASAVVKHVNLRRDIYYTPHDSRNHWADFPVTGREEPSSYRLGPDEYLALGDNSAKSKDSRFWDRRDEDGQAEHYVKRQLLIGKALMVYWPHGWPPDWASTAIVGGEPWYFPFLPNWRAMRLIR